MVCLPQSEVPRLMSWEPSLHADPLSLLQGEVKQTPTEGERVELAACAKALVSQEDLGPQVRGVAP
jgi:hypothetical protein